MNDKIEVALEKYGNMEMPSYATENDAGMDIRASEDITIAPGQTVVVRTGLRVAIPEGYEIQIRPRSGLSLKTPLRVANSPGTIDSGYRGEVGVIITNTSRDYAWSKIDGVTVATRLKQSDNTFGISGGENSNGWYVIKKDDRIAQMVLCKVYKIDFVTVDDISSIGGDRGGGFGSTGVS